MYRPALHRRAVSLDGRMKTLVLSVEDKASFGLTSYPQQRKTNDDIRGHSPALYMADYFRPKHAGRVLGGKKHGSQAGEAQVV